MPANEYVGYMLDVYPDPVSGRVSVWFLTDTGQRLHLYHHFPVSFYATGPDARLRALWKFLSQRGSQVTLERTSRRELFSTHPLKVMAITVDRASEQPELFRQVFHAFSDLEYYDADIPLSVRYAARFDAFPLTHCRVKVDQQNQIEAIDPLESRWAIDPGLPSLRLLTLTPDTDPFYDAPTSLLVQTAQREWRIGLQPERALLVVLEALLRQHDPDLIVSDWGDTWLLPRLLTTSERLPGILHLNRDRDLAAQQKASRTYQAYGQVIYRGRQVHLHGRWHIDRRNAMMYHDYGIEGILEISRVSALPVQVAARNSPGAGITAMQMITALGNSILVPYRRQQAEYYKSAEDLIDADRGGLVASPVVGLHEQVAEIDFISMYPSIIRKFNISPETMTEMSEETFIVPGVHLAVRQDQQGLLPATISPLLEKRIAIKQEMSALDPRDCRYLAYKNRASAIKWLLVVSFGYAGYRNAKFGRIEAHQAITAYAREVLLRAKEAAERQGYDVLHMYVDCLWVRKEGHSQAADFQPLLDEIARVTGLPIALDGIFRWIAFLPSRQSAELGVANRYFGVFQSGEIKMRGIETRRHDTPEFIAQAQREILAQISKVIYAKDFPEVLPQLVACLQHQLQWLYAGRIPPEQLVLRQRLTRQSDAYRSPSPSAKAARQLAEKGKTVEIGQYVRFVFTRDPTGVTAWDGSGSIDPRTVDCQRYERLFIRAAEAVLQPIGISTKSLQDWLHGIPVGSTPLVLPFEDFRFLYMDNQRVSIT